MHEHIARFLYYFEVHLIYASIVWCAAWILTSLVRGSATTKYWIWVATALNFIVPTGAILDRVWAAHLSWATPISLVGEIGGALSRTVPAITLSVVWLLGVGVMISRLYLRIRADRRAVPAIPTQSAPDLKVSLFARDVPVRFVEAGQAPAVDGILHPLISLPNGIRQLLSEQELDAVLIHEVAHAKRHDNLIRLIYEVGLCALWFHPLVWITGSRLALYRELSCDESVIQNSRGRYLVSALAKLANPNLAGPACGDPSLAESGLAEPEEALLFQATASSFLSHRLVRLAAARPQKSFRAASALLTAAFVAVLLGGVLGTISHTACCFVIRR
jgi:beta-lactamase regulating signal transducer with metallopeptidase domain